MDDLAGASVHLMNHYDDLEIINVGTGKDISIGEVAQQVKTIVGFEGDIVYDASKPDGTPRKLLDVSKLHNTGWQSKIKLEQGLRTTYEWYLEHQDDFRD